MTETREKPKLQTHIRALRSELRMTRARLAFTLNVSQNTVRDWETRPQIYHKIKDWLLLASLFGCRPFEMVTYVPLLPSIQSQLTFNSLQQRISRQLDSASEQLPHLSNKKPPQFMISQFREQLGLSQAEVASVIGICKNTLQNWETNRNSMEQFVRMLHFCTALECSPEDLVDLPKDRLEAVLLIRKTCLMSTEKAKDIINKLDLEPGYIKDTLDD